MSSKKTIFIVSGLVGSTALLATIVGAHAFGGPRGHGGHGDWGGPGMERMGGPEFGRHHGRRGHFKRGGRKGPRGLVDANKDGVISKEEATARRAKRFGKFDLDKSGDVTTEEAMNAVIKRFEGKIRRRIRMFDENGDGKVTLEEFNAPVLERFSRMDDNGDGQLTKDELPRFMQRGEGRRGKWGGRRGGPRGMWRQGPPAEQMPPAPDGQAPAQ